MDLVAQVEDLRRWTFCLVMVAFWYHHDRDNCGEDDEDEDARGPDAEETVVGNAEDSLLDLCCMPHRMVMVMPFFDNVIKKHFLTFLNIFEDF